MEDEIRRDSNVFLMGKNLNRNFLLKLNKTFTKVFLIQIIINFFDLKKLLNKINSQK